jgi:hypothetical protein
MINAEKLGEQLGTLVKAAIARESSLIRSDFVKELHKLQLEIERLKVIPQPVVPVPISIKSCTVLEDGTLSVELSDGTLLNAGKVIGPKGDKGDPGADAKGLDGDKGDPGADGVGLADAIIDRDGHLVLTLTNGRTKSLGEVIGRDGKPGLDGKPGTDGADGLSLEDLDIEMVDERHFKVFARREGKAVEKVLRVPAMIYRSIYKDGETYEPGDAVTFGGSIWIAEKEVAGKPGEDSGWRLAVKRGRDGRDFEVRDEPKGGIKL